MNGYVLLLIASLLTSGGQLCQKQAALRWRRGVPAARRGAVGWLAVAVLLMMAALLAWLGVLQRLPLSLAYPMLSLNFVLVTLCAHWFFNERITLRHWCGVACVMTGIVLMGLNL